MIELVKRETGIPLVNITDQVNLRHCIPNSPVSMCVQDWENLIYIDPSVVNQATAWMLDYQTPNGAFIETSNYTHPLDSKTNPPVSP